MNTLANALEPTIHVCGRSLQKSRITTRTVMGGTADVIPALKDNLSWFRFDQGIQNQKFPND